MHLLGFLCTIYLRFSGSNPTRLWPSENTGIMLKSVIHSLRTSLYMCTLMYIRFLCSAQDPKKLYMQGFWYFARSRICEIQVFPRNPAKFPKKHEIPRNPPEIFPNTCWQNIFNTYRPIFLRICPWKSFENWPFFR